MKVIPKVLKNLLISFIVTMVLIFIVAVLLYYFRLNQKVISVAVILIYITANFVAGHFMGKNMQNKKYLWGLLMGGVYFLVLFLVSFTVGENSGNMGSNILTTLFLCLGGGMLGGMFA